ncbi:AraC family transcriptional regulator [Paenibacillus montanisoli]|uniref:HTH araC/xylS-type domain-containing protein n=1 Tax=Paenibacillus montanisoli TaxID=2081970 RepID=A0A328U2R4_9BACL|nr:helix-turn-helix domain-containing protein [Paenibacillus montanisoli]RAP76063.1 hypothetical protein DL346_11605 [Paenibacillus montanisoli]
MHYEERQPAAQLQPFIKCIWHLERDYSLPGANEVLWPDGCQEIIFHYGSSYRPKGGAELPSAFLIGQLTRYHELIANGPIRLFGVRMLPWGLKPLFGIDPKPCLDTFVPLSEAFGEQTVSELTARLAECSLDEAVHALECFLLALLDASPPAAADMNLIEALSPLYRQPMDVDVQQAVLQSGYSQRQFERKCVELIGMPPKRLHLIARFNQARLRIFWNPAIDLHQCMLDMGYYDYAHFSKAFKQCLGITPAEYQRWIGARSKAFTDEEHVVFLQDEG